MSKANLSYLHKPVLSGLLVVNKDSNQWVCVDIVDSNTTMGCECCHEGWTAFCQDWHIGTKAQCHPPR